MANFIHICTERVSSYQLLYRITVVNDSTGTQHQFRPQVETTGMPATLDLRRFTNDTMGNNNYMTEILCLLLSLIIHSRWVSITSLHCMLVIHQLSITEYSGTRIPIDWGYLRTHKASPIKLRVSRIEGFHCTVNFWEMWGWGWPLLIYMQS